MSFTAARKPSPEANNDAKALSAPKPPTKPSVKDASPKARPFPLASPPSSFSDDRGSASPKSPTSPKPSLLQRLSSVVKRARTRSASASGANSNKPSPSPSPRPKPVPLPSTGVSDSSEARRPTVQPPDTVHSEPIITHTQPSPVATRGRTRGREDTKELLLLHEQERQGQDSEAGHAYLQPSSPPATLAHLPSSASFEGLPANSGGARASSEGGLSPPNSPPRPAHVGLYAPRRSSTSPIPSSVSVPLLRVHKRLIVCCDGTWQDGIVKDQRWMYSNVLKIARSIAHEDDRHHPPIQQIVFYQSGLGSEDNPYSHFVDGAFGTHLAEKVQEAYAFLAQNYYPGDEIFLFGFSRGAYTARMVATFVGEIGMLDRTQMDHFAEIFVAYQKRGKADNDKERAKYNEILAPFESTECEGKNKVRSSGPFSVKCIGVFDTVGSLGLPAELTPSPRVRTLFDFPDKILGEHIERAYHAMGLDERRLDFDVTKFEQTSAGKEKGQTLVQTWFAGEHTDVGGGWQDHDLSDLALVWMIAHIEDILAIDQKYFKALPAPVKPWGRQGPHWSKSGLFRLGGTAERHISVPSTEPGEPITNEWIHRSVLEQAVLSPSVVKAINTHPEMIAHLLPLEREIQENWHYIPGETPERQDSDQARIEEKSQAKARDALTDALKKAAKKGKDVVVDVAKEVVPGQSTIVDVEQTNEAGEVVQKPAGKNSRFKESSMARVWDEMVGNSDVD